MDLGQVIGLVFLHLHGKTRSGSANEVVGKAGLNRLTFIKADRG